MKIKLVSAYTTALFATVSNSSAAEWKFGLMGDTQWESNEDGKNPNTVAVGIIKQVNAEFIKHKVKLVLQVGDLVNTYSSTAFDTRAQAAQELLDAGIGFFPLRGNHESSGSAANHFSEAFPQVCGHINTFGAINFRSASYNLECLSYSFDYNNVRFVLIDQFTRKDNSGDNHNIVDQLGWIDSTLNNKARNSHAFVLAHKNLIGQNHTDVLFGGKPSSNINAQNSFFRTLALNRVRYFLSGHDHLHFRSIVTSPDRKFRVKQLIVASNSYKFYTPNSRSNDEKYNSPTREQPIAEELYSIGYYIFSIDGPLVVVDYYSSLNGCGGTWGDGEECELSETPSLSFIKRETFGYSLNGKDYTIEPDEPLTVVSDSCKISSSVKTIASIISGKNEISKEINDGRKTIQNITTGWISQGKKNDSLQSDIFILWGMANDLGSGESDIYTLSMSYSEEIPGSLVLVSKDSSGNWSRAVNGNFGGEPKFVAGPFKTEFGLGTYGIDTSKNTVWAIMNHGGKFSVAKGTDGEIMNSNKGKYRY